MAEYYMRDYGWVDPEGEKNPFFGVCLCHDRLCGAAERGTLGAATVAESVWWYRRTLVEVRREGKRIILSCPLVRRDPNGRRYDPLNELSGAQRQRLGLPVEPYQPKPSPGAPRWETLTRGGAAP